MAPRGKAVVPSVADLDPDLLGDGGDQGSASVTPPADETPAAEQGGDVQPPAVTPPVTPPADETPAAQAVPVRQVTREVYVGGVLYRPGDVPPAEHAALITNPKVWA